MSRQANIHLPFPEAAKTTLADTQMRNNIAIATANIQRKRANAVAEVSDWEILRERGRAINNNTLLRLDEALIELETNVKTAGGVVHWARDANEANHIILNLVKKSQSTEVLKVKSMTTEEIGLNDFLEINGVTPIETDLAEMIIQLGNDRSSHILVPAIHWNRVQICTLFQRKLDITELNDTPEELTAAARAYLRRKFLEVKVAISGANFAVAETGAVGVVESEGNGRMCLTLPQQLITVMGIDKVIQHWSDLGTLLQLLPRSATGERMNPYTSIWTGVHKGDGPQEFHLVLLDNGRTRIMKSPIARQTLHCIRCSACVNVCPVYKRTGGHAYNSPYSGPIGAILSPQLWHSRQTASLPFASTLCGACADVCPVKIDIPEILVHLRSDIEEQKQAKLKPERIVMKLMAKIFRNHRYWIWLLRLARILQVPFMRGGRIQYLPPPLNGWTASRNMKPISETSFRDWWRQR